MSSLGQTIGAGLTAGVPVLMAKYKADVDAKEAANLQRFQAEQGALTRGQDASQFTEEIALKKKQGEDEMTQRQMQHEEKMSDDRAIQQRYEDTAARSEAHWQARYGTGAGGPTGKAVRTMPLEKEVIDEIDGSVKREKLGTIGVDAYGNEVWRKDISGADLPPPDAPGTSSTGTGGAPAPTSAGVGAAPTKPKVKVNSAEELGAMIDKANPGITPELRQKKMQEANDKYGFGLDLGGKKETPVAEKPAEKPAAKKEPANAPYNAASSPVNETVSAAAVKKEAAKPPKEEDLDAILAKERSKLVDYEGIALSAKDTVKKGAEAVASVDKSVRDSTADNTAKGVAKVLMDKLVQEKDASQEIAQLAKLPEDKLRGMGLHSKILAMIMEEKANQSKE